MADTRLGREGKYENDPAQRDAKSRQGGPWTAFQFQKMK